MKIGRISPNSDGSAQFVVDLFTTDQSDDTTPMKTPSGIPDPLAWLQGMFGTLKSSWDSTSEQFRPLPDGVLSGATFFGDRANDADVADASMYDNGNGFYADGSAVPPPPDPAP